MDYSSLDFSGIQNYDPMTMGYQTSWGNSSDPASGGRDGGFGFNPSTFNSIGVGLQGIGSLVGAYANLKNYGLAKDNLAFQKSAFEDNFALQRGLLEERLNTRNATRAATYAGNNQGSLEGYRDTGYQSIYGNSPSDRLSSNQQPTNGNRPVNRNVPVQDNRYRSFNI